MDPIRKGGVRRHFSYANVMSTLAVFLVVAGGTALAAKVNSSKDIAKESIKNSDVQKETLKSDRLKDGKAVKGDDVVDGSITGTDVTDESIAGIDITDASITAAELAPDSVGSAAIASGAVGADELQTVHEHFSAATNIVDTTAHDGQYSTNTATVTCGAGEDLLGVSVDWTNTAGHNETMFTGVDSINRAGDDSAVVRVGFDGGPGPATFQAVATCIF